MRRLLLLLACVLCLTALPVAAQTPEVTPAAPTSDAQPAALSAAVAQAQAAAAEAEKHMNDAERYAGDSSRFFGLFESFGFVLAAVAVVLGLIGGTRLFSEQNELKEVRRRFESELSAARQQFQEEITSQETEVESLRKQLAESVERQLKMAEQATLVQAVLPFGERQYRAQDFKGAVGTFRRALAFNESNPLIHYRLGYVYVQSGQLTEAENHLKRALELDPEFELARAALGYVYRRMGDKLPEGMERDQMHNKAESLLLEALNRSPKLVDDDSESWWGALGGLYRRRGQINQAIHAYEEAGRVTPLSSYPFSNLALLYMAKHDRAKMLETYKRVERLARGEAYADVDNFWAYADLLTSRLAFGKVDEAVEALQSVFDIAPPDSPYALESLADTLTRLVDALGGPEAAPHIPHVIQTIRERSAAQQQAES